MPLLKSRIRRSRRVVLPTAETRKLKKQEITMLDALYEKSIKENANIATKLDFELPLVISSAKKINIKTVKFDHSELYVYFRRWPNSSFMYKPYKQTELDLVDLFISLCKYKKRRSALLKCIYIFYLEPNYSIALVKVE